MSEATPSAPPVELRRVSKWYGDVVAVADVSFTVGAGVTGLLGPNGAGKTSTLKVLVGLSRPSQGEVLLYGRPLLTDPELYRSLGIVPDEERLYPRMTVRNFVRLHAELQGLEDVGAASDRALQTVGMTQLRDRKMAGLSKGEKQRTKVAGAIVHQPALLVLDEPMTGLDPAQRAGFVELIRALGASGVTVIVSSHILAEVERLASRVLVLVGGRLAAEGDFHAIRDLMDDRPRTVTIRTAAGGTGADAARRLGTALLELPSTVAIEVKPDAVEARTRSLASFATALPRLARDLEVSLREVQATDESLEQVFRYLVERR
jgi:ABC-2 type transport system ATP-binding protein